MQKAAQFLFLHVASRVLAICAVVAGIAPGFLLTFAAAYTCFDSCPTRASYFSRLGPSAVQLLTPCVVLDALALAVFLAYCVATRQARRTIAPLLALLVGGLVGAAALAALLQHGQATLPVIGDDILAEAPVEAWATQWGLALMFVAGAWSGVLAYLQWRR